MKSIYVLPGIMLLLVSAGIYAADEFKIKPGLWEITTTTSGATQPQSKTIQECIENDTINPQDMIKDLPEDDCTVDTKVSGNTMTYDLSCNMHGMVMEGSGKMQSFGDTMTADIDFRGSMNGMAIETSTSSKGKRIGNC